MSNPSMTATNLQVLRHYDGNGPLQKILTPSAATKALFPTKAVPAGRVMHQNASGEAELGVGGTEVPFWSFRDSNRPSTGWSGESPKTATGLTWADGSSNGVLHFVGIEGLEIATTELAEAASNFTNNSLVASRRTDDAAYSTNEERANGAGKIYTTGVLNGKDAVVGVVSAAPGSYTKFGNTYVTLYTLYRPPVGGLVDGLTQPTWQS